MKKLMALVCTLMMFSVIVSEAQAQRRGGDDDEWRRRRGGDTRRDGGDRGRRDNGRGDRDVRRPPRHDNDRDVRRPPRHDNDRDVRRPPRHDNDRDVRRPPRHREPDYRRDRHTRYHHRPNWNRPGSRYTRYTHRPQRDRVNHRRHYARRYDYHRTIPYRFIYFDRWVRYRVTYNDGYLLIDGYPYYVYNGYRHRYSSYDICDYDLVDGYTNSVERTFYGYTCAQAYDYCADLRDDLNWRRSDYRYFCSESLDYSNGSYSNWNYDDDFYYDVY